MTSALPAITLSTVGSSFVASELSTDGAGRKRDLPRGQPLLIRLVRAAMAKLAFIIAEEMRALHYWISGR